MTKTRKPRVSKLVFEDEVHAVVWLKSPDTGKLEPMSVHKRTPSLTEWVSRDELDYVDFIHENLAHAKALAKNPG